MRYVTQSEAVYTHHCESAPRVTHAVGSRGGLNQVQPESCCKVRWTRQSTALLHDDLISFVPSFSHALSSDRHWFQVYHLRMVVDMVHFSLLVQMPADGNVCEIRIRRNVISVSKRLFDGGNVLLGDAGFVQIVDLIAN